MITSVGRIRSRNSGKDQNDSVISPTESEKDGSVKNKFPFKLKNIIEKEKKSENNYNTKKNEKRAKQLKQLNNDGDYIPICVWKGPIGVTLWHDGDSRRAFVIDVSSKEMIEQGIKIGDFVYSVGKYTVYDAKHSQILNCIRYFAKNGPIYLIFFRSYSVSHIPPNLTPAYNESIDENKQDISNGDMNGDMDMKKIHLCTQEWGFDSMSIKNGYGENMSDIMDNVINCWYDRGCVMLHFLHILLQIEVKDEREKKSDETFIFNAKEIGLQSVNLPRNNKDNDAMSTSLMKSCIEWIVSYISHWCHKSNQYCKDQLYAYNPSGTTLNQMIEKILKPQDDMDVSMMKIVIYDCVRLTMVYKSCLQFLRNQANEATTKSTKRSTDYIDFVNKHLIHPIDTIISSNTLNDKYNLTSMAKQMFELVEQEQELAYRRAKLLLLS